MGGQEPILTVGEDEPMEEGPEAVKTDGRPGAGKGHHYKKQAQGPEVAQAGVANGVLSVQDDPRKAQDYSEEHPHVPGADEPLHRFFDGLAWAMFCSYLNRVNHEYLFFLILRILDLIGILALFD